MWVSGGARQPNLRMGAGYLAYRPPYTCRGPRAAAVVYVERPRRRLSSIVYLLSSVFYRLSSIVYLLSSVFYRLPSIVYLLSSTFYRLSSIVYRLSSTFPIVYLPYPPILPTLEAYCY